MSSALRDFGWHPPDEKPPVEGEYVAALDPLDAAPTVRRFYNGVSWSDPYHVNWPEASKLRARLRQSAFSPYWKYPPRKAQP